jgi:hypothetical protein
MPTICRSSLLLCSAALSPYCYAEFFYMNSAIYWFGLVFLELLEIEEIRVLLDQIGLHTYIQYTL